MPPVMSTIKTAVFIDKLEHAHENITLRSSHQRCSVRKDVLRKFAKFTGKYA